MKAKYIILSVLALTLVACEKDFFETESPSAMDEAVFKSADLTQQAIGAIYNCFGEDKSFRNRLCGGYVAMNTDIEHCSKTEDAEYAAYNMTGGTGNLSTSNGKDPWAYLNSAIERANVVIDGIRLHSDTTDATFKYLLGEALTLRAFCYLEMVKLWGDVPACFESFNGHNSEVLYTKKQDRNVVFEQLRIDLKDAARLMPWSAQCPGNAGNYTGRPSKALAYGLLARMDLMYAGLAMRPDVFTEGGTKACSVQYNVKDAGKRQELYQEAVWACAQVIKQEDHKFKDNFEDVFKDLCQDVTDYSKSEWIWALPFLDGARGQVLALTGNKMSTNCAGNLINTISFSQGNNNNAKTQAMIEIVPTFYYAYDKNDKRRDITILPWTWEYDNGEGTGSSYTDKVFPGVAAADKKLYQKQSNVGQMYLGKLRVEWMKRSYSSNEDCIDMPVLRYTDILLMFAEAAIGSREGNAPGNLYGISPQQCLDRVRARAGLASKPLDFNAIVDERAFEFCGENLRKYDLMRWGLLREKLEKAQADVYDLQKGIGAYAGRPDSVYFHFVRNDAYAQNGAAYIFDRFIGLDLDATRPAEFDKENGWVAKSFFDKEGVPDITTENWYLFKAGTNIDMHQYWPIFDVNIAASNGTLWNDYEY
ncbi:MAG: RagB/SusD family nutrient uptake outer membrane protein [Paludibacteraceae bacterium]|nr:RagB/SusD family nutrient uptake outer membrane protein [Paludibacteraceae bacterium]